MFISKSIARISLAMIVAAGGCLLVGCTSPAKQSGPKLAEWFKTPKWMTKAPWSKDDSDPPEPYPNPAKIASTWTSDVLVKAGKTPTRGFGGRLFFFDEHSKAVPVEGTLTVHGFEIDSDGKDSQIRPFKFTPEQFTRHFSQSDFGASYSIWIPWDAAGGEEKRVSLVTTFETKEGKVVQGSPTTVILPGRRKEADDVQVAGDRFSAKYTAHRQALTENTPRPSGLVTTTIRRHTASGDGSDDVPAGSLRQRIAAMAASRAAGRSDGETPFAEVTLSPRTPRVQAASAEMPMEVSGPRRAAPPAKPLPRRISPVRDQR